MRFQSSKPDAAKEGLGSHVRFKLSPALILTGPIIVSFGRSCNSNSRNFYSRGRSASEVSNATMRTINGTMLLARTLQHGTSLEHPRNKAREFYFLVLSRRRRVSCSCVGANGLVRSAEAPAGKHSAIMLRSAPLVVITTGIFINRFSVLI